MYYKHPITYLIPLFCFVFSGLTAQQVIRGPYLQFSTTNSIYIKWRTDIPTDSKVWYGDDHTNLINDVSDSELTTEHELQITGLNPNTEYFYAVGTTSLQLSGATNEHYFKTHPLPNTNQAVNIWVLGDAGSKDDAQRGVRDAYYNYNGSDHIDMMLLLGDNAYEVGSDEDYQYSWFENMYEDRLINSVMWSCYGNHEAGSANSANQTGVYFDIYNFPTNAELGGAPSGTESYFSFDYANIHVISLNSHDEDREVDGPMLTWLQEDLALTDKDWIIALIHHPPYSGYGGNNSDTNTRERDMRENALPILEDAGVDLVLVGHTHAYQRSYLINGHYDISATFNPDIMALDIGDGKSDGDAPYIKAIGGPNDGKGTVYLNTGAAGKLSTNHLLAHPVMYHNNSAKNGSVAIEVNGLQMDVFHIDIDEDIDDHFTIIKQTEPPEITLLNPLDGTFFQDIEPMTISADASDSNGSIDKVAFYVDNVLLETDYTNPYTFNWTPPAEGGYRIKAIATDNDGNFKSAVSNIQIGPVSVCSAILGNSDDAEEDQFGDVTMGSSDLEITFDDSHQTIGLRFKNLGIPKNSIINSAYIQFTSQEPGNINPCEINIYAEDVDDSESFMAEDFDLSTRQKTEATVLWSPEDWGANGDNGSAQKTVDISAVIQEVVYRSTYSEKSTIGILMDGIGRRRAFSKNGDATKAPVLCLEYNPFCPDSDSDGTCDAVDQCPGIEPGTFCDDGNPDTFDDAIDEDCNCTGKTYDCPEHSAFFGELCDDNDPNTYNDVWNINCDCQGSYASMTYACSAVNAASDDAEEKESGSVSLDSGDLEMVFDNSNQTVGLRFTGLNLPFGAIIQYANIQFTSDKTDNENPCVINIYGEATANPTTFTETPFDISSRPRTNANVSWSPADWRKKGKAEQAEQTIDIAPVIQEVVNRWGFTDTSAVVILIDGIGKRTAESFDGDPEEAALLCVDYYIDEPPGGGIQDVPQMEFPDKKVKGTVTGKALNKIKLYPNPANNRLHLSFNSSKQDATTFVIRDISGRMVFTTNVNSEMGDNHFLIPQLNLADGVYIAQMRLNDEWQSVRLVVIQQRR